MKRKSAQDILVYFLIVVFAVSFIIYGQDLQKDTQAIKGQTLKTVAVYIGQTRLTAYVADTEVLRERGLGGRIGLLPDEAMLFIFDAPAPYGFWMKDMRFAIDMVWLDESKRVVWIEHDVSPDTFPKVFTPNSPAKYVLEVSAGFSEENELKIGTAVSF